LTARRIDAYIISAGGKSSKEDFRTNKPDLIDRAAPNGKIGGNETHNNESPRDKKLSGVLADGTRHLPVGANHGL
jgi:hypothetical protein